MVETKYFADISYDKINRYLQSLNWENELHDLDDSVNVYSHADFPNYAICIPKAGGNTRIRYDYWLLDKSLTEFGNFYNKNIYEILDEIRKI